jgi:hypothetical protein
MPCSMADVYQLSEELAGSILNFFLYPYLYYIFQLSIIFRIDRGNNFLWNVSNLYLTV